jgi:hypothetical protein
MIEELILEDLPETKKKDTKKKKKGIWSKSYNEKKLIKKHKVAVLYLTKNGEARPLELEPKNGFFTIKGKAYHEREDCTWVMGKQRIPLAIIPEGEIIPMGKEQWQEKNIKEKFLEVQTHAMKGIRHAELVKLSGEENKGGITAKGAILIGIMVIIGIAIWQGGLI